MAYGLKYTTTFDSFQGQPYTLNISEKDYIGDSETTLLAGVGVTLSYPKDEMKPAIKGLECAISKVNLGSLPITAFMSESDDLFLVEVLWGLQNIFTGYLVQDDFNEDLVSWNHPITLKANDSLGLLKEVDLNDAAITFGTESTLSGVTIEQSAINKIQVTGTITVNEKQVLTLDTGTVLDGQYSVKTWQYLAGTITEITFDQDLNGTYVPPVVGDIILITPIDLTQRMFISDILALCLKSTGIRLPIIVYGLPYPEDALNGRLFDNTLMDPTTFERSEDKWDNCYKVIEDILGRFYYSLFQAEGKWNIVRWDDSRITDTGIPGKGYDEDFTYIGMNSLSNLFTAGVGELTIAETGLNYTPIRAFKYALELFQYRNPVLIKNINFTDVGELLSVTIDGTDTINDYAMVGWEQGFEWTSGGAGYIGSTAQRIIRVILDSQGNEKDRYGVIKGNSGFDDYACAQSNGVEVVPGDIIRYSFDYKTNTSQPGNVNNYFRVNLLTTVNPVPKAANNRYLASDGKWYTAGPFLLNNTTLGDNTNVYHTVTVESDPVPFPGLLILKLAQSVLGVSSIKETHYKNIRFEIVRNISGSKKITGHQHRDQQLPNIKNNSDRSIEIDNSPSNALAGTLFYDTFTGPVRDRVLSWNYNGDIIPNIGQIVTTNELFWHRKTRIKIEGSLKGLVQGGKHLSMLSTLIYTFFTDKRFNFGSLDLILKDGMCNCTFWENYEDGEVSTDLRQWYDFKYLFDK